MFEFALVAAAWPSAYDEQTKLVAAIPATAWMLIDDVPRSVYDGVEECEFLGARKLLTAGATSKDMYYAWKAGARGIVIIRGSPIADVPVSCAFTVESNTVRVHIVGHTIPAVLGNFAMLEEAGTITAKALHRQVWQFCLKSGFLRSHNQNVSLLVNGRALPSWGGVLWRKSFATRPSKTRLKRKTNLAKRRLAEQVSQALLNYETWLGLQTVQHP